MDAEDSSPNGIAATRLIDLARIGILLGGRDECDPGLESRMLGSAELSRPAACRAVPMSGIPAIALVTESGELLAKRFG